MEQLFLRSIAPAADRAFDAKEEALTALYAVAVQTVVHRDVPRPRDVLRVTSECGLVVGGILLPSGRPSDSPTT